MSDLRIGRRLLAAGAASLPAAAQARPRPATGWETFKTRFLTPEGRIIDTANGNVSHSEGQAWGLLLAVRHQDRQAFDQILQWTHRRLGLRGDGLLAWRFRPGPGPGGGVVDDLNNATDADLYFAWALTEAQRQWPDGDYITLARRSARAMLGQLTRQVNGRTVMLPGAWGFEQRGNFVLNPSYYVSPAMRVLAEVVPHPAWGALMNDTPRLMGQARFGQWQLPADWVVMDGQSGRVSVEPQRGDRFGYDALRVLLNGVWAGGMDRALSDSAARFWTDRRHPYVPAWTVLSTGSISPYPAGEGVSAISALVMASRAGWGAAGALGNVERARHYYECALLLLARQAWADLERRGDVSSAAS
ncbi:glycosyl hydrolase family 5 [Rhodovarius crocodyli]|uniref:cellulase n=1 Tax=Rhodovarius crocodyli TaxID=1979269 RepID=A0A437ME21_9PROT|nr:glycosyl hydrolase family 8 [Rhodovarius crocodyli]RVT95876.1 glycosyl hydrolase family 5 [Rhodovarius crocodyli]